MTVLASEVGAAEPVVGPWQQRFVPAAAAGFPAHVTVLAPFLDIDRCTEAVIEELGTLISAHHRFIVQFDQFGRFPEVLYLIPEPSQPFGALTAAVVERWPEAPPYGGQFARVTPHLTVARSHTPEILDQVETALTGHLPIQATIAAVSLFVSDGRTWQRRTEFPLA